MAYKRHYITNRCLWCKITKKATIWILIMRFYSDALELSTQKIIKGFFWKWLTSSKICTVHVIKNKSLLSLFTNFIFKKFAYINFSPISLKMLLVSSPSLTCWLYCFFSSDLNLWLLSLSCFLFLCFRPWCL